MMKVLISGIDGFIASHLAEYIVNEHKHVEVIGTKRFLASMDNIKKIQDKITLVDMELTDAKSVEDVIEHFEPDKVFHLAAQSFVPMSWNAPNSTVNANINGTVNVLEAVKNVSPNTYVQLAGSSEEYGYVTPDECPIKETNPLRPLSPYAVSKVATDFFGYQYARSYQMNILRTRTFNQTGPRRGEAFVDSNFAKQIVEIETGKRAVLSHGNLSAIRDFTDVRDTVKAYWALSERKWNGEVLNICSGKGHTMESVVDTLKNLSHADIKTVLDETRMRPSDVPILVGDNTRMKMYIDWNPQIEWKQSLEDLLDYWRIKLTGTNARVKYPELRT